MTGFRQSLKDGTEMNATQILAELLCADYPVGEEACNALAAHAHRHTCHRKECLVQQGELSGHIYFIVKGLFRGTAVINGREDTLFFGTKGDPFASVHTLAHQQPAAISLQALEDSEVLAVAFDDFLVLLDEYADLQKWWSAMLLEQVYALERRYVWLTSCDASERYDTFTKVRPHIHERIPLKYIAQYINVTPETLSRIRSRAKR